VVAKRLSQSEKDQIAIRMKTPIFKSSAMPHLLILVFLMSLCLDTTMAAPHGTGRHFQLGDAIRTYLSTARSTPADSSFQPQPQYITLTPPIRQLQTQNEVEVGASPLTAEELPCRGGFEKGADPKSIIEDWKAWKQQFGKQTKERSCRLHKKGCASIRKRI
jgi:hypothetical protein